MASESTPRQPMEPQRRVAVESVLDVGAGCCFRKRAYPTERRAMLYAQDLSAKLEGAPVGVYGCPLCAQFHLTTKVDGRAIPVTQADHAHDRTRTRRHHDAGRSQHVSRASRCRQKRGWA